MLSGLIFALTCTRGIKPSFAIVAVTPVFSINPGNTISVSFVCGVAWLSPVELQMVACSLTSCRTVLPECCTYGLTTSEIKIQLNECGWSFRAATMNLMTTSELQMFHRPGRLC